MSFRVSLTRNAAADLERRLTDIAERSPALAQRLNNRFERPCFDFAIFPLLAVWPTRTGHSPKS